ncbi:hypothetical protein [Brevundimonas sp.]|jgi:hypothetical protein
MTRPPTESAEPEDDGPDIAADDAGASAMAERAGKEAEHEPEETD